MITDANSVILKVNQAFVETTGYTADEVVGQTPRKLKSGRHNADFYRAMWETIKTTGGWQGEVWDRRKNGEEYPKWLTISAVKGDDGVVTHYIGSHFDITERKNAEDKINELAYFDQLTHLPNRTLLLDRLKQVMTASSRNETHGALLFIPLCQASCRLRNLNFKLRGHNENELFRGIYRTSASEAIYPWRPNDTNGRGGFERQLPYVEELDEKENGGQGWSIGRKGEAAPGLDR
jgi:PAS domain S-box-containing protein